MKKIRGVLLFVVFFAWVGYMTYVFTTTGNLVFNLSLLLLGEMAVILLFRFLGVKDKQTFNVVKSYFLWIALTLLFFGFVCFYLVALPYEVIIESDYWGVALIPVEFRLAAIIGSMIALGLLVLEALWRLGLVRFFFLLAILLSTLVSDLRSWSFNADTGCALIGIILMLIDRKPWLKKQNPDLKLRKRFKKIPRWVWPGLLGGLAGYILLELTKPSWWPF